MMLELRPNCECCDKDLAPESTEAYICSYECTFCISCVENILLNVCPNCGGGFAARPIRPKIEFKKGVGLTCHPASKERIHMSYSLQDISEFSGLIHTIDPENR